MSQKSKDPLIIETSERCICLNEGCAGNGEHTEIHRHNVVMNIDRVSGDQIIRALCQNCGRLYRVTRRAIQGAWVVQRIEIIADSKTITAFQNRLAAAAQIQQKDLPPVTAA